MQQTQRVPGTAAILLSAMAAVAVFGLCGGVSFFGLLAISNGTASVGSKANPNDRNPFLDERWVQRVLFEVYTRAVDHVVVHESVIENLGEPVEIDGAAERPFRRVNSGDFGAAGETIEFDLMGPNGKGVVRVVIIGADARFVRFKTITLVLENGAEIEIGIPLDPNVRL